MTDDELLDQIEADSREIGRLLKRRRHDVLRARLRGISSRRIAERTGTSHQIIEYWVGNSVKRIRSDHGR